MLVVITYDITDDKIRGKVANELKNHGMRVQKSIFECYLDKDQINKLKDTLETMVDITIDHVRFYYMCKKDKVAVDGIKIIYRDEDYFMI